MDFSNDKIFQSLNPEQRSAALAREGAHLVIAGPGTGKTHTMTARAHLLAASGIPVSNILLMTFTKKAASEISDRLSRIKQEYAGITTGTFHSVAIRLLREYGQREKLAIIDEDDERAMLDAWFQYIVKPDEKNRFALDGKPGDLLYSAYRQRSYRDGYAPAWSWAEEDSNFEFSEFRKAVESMIASSAIPDFRDKSIDEIFIDVAQSFDARKFHVGKLSFDDCIVAATKLLTEQDIDTGYSFVSVDEFQDSDKSQLEFVKALVAPYGNVFAVGDDKQSIYCWRGAYPGIFDDFRRTYEPQGLSEISLVRNYRSTAKIIDAVNSVAAARPTRSDRIIPTGDTGKNPVLFNTPKPADLTFELIRSRLKNGDNYQDIAILYRGHYGASQDLQLRLTEARIPYVVVGGKSITERLLFKRFRDCIRFVNDPIWSVPLFNIAKLLPEIGDKAAFHLSASLSEQGDIRQMCRAIDAGNLPTPLIAPARKWLRPLLLSLRDFNESTRPLQIFDAAIPCLAGLCFFRSKKQVSEYLLALEKADYPSWGEMQSCRASEMLGNPIKGLAKVIGSFSEKFRNTSEWLDAMTFDEVKADKEDAIVLSTIHGAKGKEWNTVVIGECNDGIFFSKRYLLDLHKRYERESRTENFEEWMKTAPETMEIRNLFYVAASRAKKQLAVVRTGDFRLIDELSGHGFVNSRGKYFVTQREKINGMEQEVADTMLNDREMLEQYREENKINSCNREQTFNVCPS